MCYCRETERERERERLFYIRSMRPVEGMSAFRTPLQNPKVLLTCLDLQGSLNISWITHWTLLITHYPLHISVTQKNQQVLTEHKTFQVCRVIRELMVSVYYEWMNEWGIYIALSLCMAVHPKCFTIIWGWLDWIGYWGLCWTGCEAQNYLLSYLCIFCALGATTTVALRDKITANGNILGKKKRNEKYIKHYCLKNVIKCN